MGKLAFSMSWRISKRKVIERVLPHPGPLPLGEGESLAVAVGAARVVIRSSLCKLTLRELWLRNDGDSGSYHPKGWFKN